MAIFHGGLKPAAGSVDAYSLRFNSADIAFLQQTPSSEGNRQTWTWSGWVKKADNDNENVLFSVHSSGADVVSLQFQDTGVLNFYDFLSGYRIHLHTTRKFRDPNAWYHIVVTVDTTQAVSSDRVKIYVNGVQETSFSTSVYPSQNQNLKVNTTTSKLIGKRSDFAVERGLDGNLAHVNFVDGQALGPESFGESGDYGEWKPIEYTGGHGTNGYYLDFKYNSSLGNDASANSNNFTLNNIAASDQVLDNPENNYCTFNTLNRINAAPPLKEGNLLLDSSNSDARFQPANMVVSSGKWYAEFMAPSGSGMIIGVLKGSSPLPSPATYLGGSGSNTPDSGTGVYLNVDNGNTSVVFNYQNLSSHNSLTTGGVTFTSNDVLGIVLDMDYSNGGIEGAAFAYKNGTIIATGLTDNRITDYSLKAVDSHWMFCAGNNATYTVVANFGQDSTFAGNTTAGGNADSNGYGNFKYTPPMSSLALCTANLPEPAVKPAEHFNTILYTGNASVRSITGVGFQPDLIWGKQRNGTNAHAIVDSVRGNTKYLSSQRNNAEDTQTDVVTSFDSDGFSLGASGGFDMNQSGSNLVAWSWKAGGAAVSNTDGSVTTQVSANTNAGFSIVTWTGTDANATIGHGLSQDPEMVIIKSYTFSSNPTGWPVTADVAGMNESTLKFNQLDLTNSVFSDNGNYFQNTLPTAAPSNVFHVGGLDSVNGSGRGQIAYCFHGVEGYSKIGSYEGNGNSDGAFIYTGFAPKWIMHKCITQSSAWVLWDTERSPSNVITNGDLQADSNQTEGQGNWGVNLDIVSNGFKFRNSDANAFNANGEKYLYLAFAEQPFKYTNAR